MIYKVTFLLKNWEQSRAVTATHWKGSSRSITKVYGGLLFVNQQQRSYTLEMSWEFRRKIKNIILACKIDSKRKVLFSLLFPNQSVIAFDSRNRIKALGCFWNWCRKPPPSFLWPFWTFLRGLLWDMTWFGGTKLWLKSHSHLNYPGSIKIN